MRATANNKERRDVLNSEAYSFPLNAYTELLPHTGIDLFPHKTLEITDVWRHPAHRKASDCLLSHLPLGNVELL